MPISKRLRALAELVDEGAVIADIGCDHGLLPIYLVQKHICSKAYACDLREGPLCRAQAAIENARLCGTISTILTDGLYGLPADVDTILIAGMGYETIQKILEDNLAVVKSCRCLILQSNTEVPLLRAWLSEHRFLIIIDKVIKDGHFYHLLKCIPADGVPLTEDQLLFGTTQHSEDFLLFCNFELEKTEKILKNLNAENKNYKKFYDYKKKLQRKIKEKMELANTN